MTHIQTQDDIRMWGNNPEICDIVEPDHVAPAHMNPYDNGLGGYSYNQMAGLSPELGHPPDQSPQWLSPSPLSGQRFPGNVHENEDSKSESTSSTSNSNGHIMANGMHSSPEASAPKSRKPRGKSLNDVEAELMQKDDADLTEAELAIKRKAQNRLAQRAFRERKETKLKELQGKLLESEEERQKLLEQLEEIKSQYISVQTENALLRKTPPQEADESSRPKFVFPSNVFPESQDQFVSEMITDPRHVLNEETMNKVYEAPKSQGQKVLAVGAVWDFLQIKREEEKYEDIDMFEVMQLLKGKEVCHGYGPAFPLHLVQSALEAVANKQ